MPTKEQIREELENLQLDEARASAETRRTKVLQRKNRAAAIEISLKRDRENQETIQAACWHKKGGKGTSQLYQGNDANYAVVKHTLSHGPTIVVCQRCGKLWQPPEVPKKNASPEVKAKYREDLMEYRRALNLPTDNEPSGTVLFAFNRDDAA